MWKGFKVERLELGEINFEPEKNAGHSTPAQSVRMLGKLEQVGCRTFERIFRTPSHL